MEILDVPLAKLTLGKNSRKAPDPYHPPSTNAEASPLYLLAESMREVGQLVPVAVRATSDGFELVFGYRRVAAAKHLGWKTIRAMVVTVDPFLPNAVENLARRELGGPDFMDLCADARERKIDATTFARSVGVSRSLVANNLRAFDKVHPTILEAWRAYPGRFALRELLELAVNGTDDQLAWYRERVRDAPAPAAPPEGGEEDAPKEAKKRAGGGAKAERRMVRSRAELELCVRYLKDGTYGDRSPDWIRGARAMLHFALGGEVPETTRDR